MLSYICDFTHKRLDYANINLFINEADLLYLKSIVFKDVREYLSSDARQQELEKQKLIEATQQSSLQAGSSSCSPTVKTSCSILSPSPTSLGAYAVNEILAQLNHSNTEVNALNSIDFVIGDSATPLELTPSEGQRIAGAVGLKKPTYDIQAGSASFSAACEYLLSSYKNLPNTTLWVSSNVIDLILVDEQKDLLNSNATAILFSKESGEYQISTADYFCDLEVEPKFSIAPNGSANFTEWQAERFFNQSIKPLLSAALKYSKTGSEHIGKNDTRIILPVNCESLKQICIKEFNLDSSKVLMPKCKYSLGGDFGEALSQAISQKASQVLIIQAGGGYGQGYVVLNRL